MLDIIVKECESMYIFPDVLIQKNTYDENDSILRSANTDIAIEKVKPLICMSFFTTQL